MSIVSGPNSITNNSGLIYRIDPGNIKCYNYYENLYPQSETLTNFNIPGPYFTSGGPYGGSYYITTTTSAQATASNYFFDFNQAPSLQVNQGDVITQTWHVIPVLTATNTASNIGVRFWSGTNRAWLEYVEANFYLPTLSVTAIQGPTTGSNYTTASIALLSSGWYRLSFTAEADASGYVATSLYNSQLETTGTQYGVAAHQVEKNTGFTNYIATFGNPQYRSQYLNDLSNTYKTSSTLTTLPLYSTSNGGYFNMGSFVTATSTASYIITPLIGTNTSMSIIPNSSVMQFTMSIWANFTSVITTATNTYIQTLIGCFNYEGFGIYWTPNGTTSTMTVGTEFRTNNPFFGQGAGQVIVPLNTWKHYAFVYSWPQNLQQLYVNGVLIGNYSGSLPAAMYTATFSSINNNEPITIASPYVPTSYGSQPEFPGQIGVASIYNQALSASQIQQEFNAYRGRYGV